MRPELGNGPLLCFRLARPGCSLEERTPLRLPPAEALKRWSISKSLEQKQRALSSSCRRRASGSFYARFASLTCPPVEHCPQKIVGSLGRDR